MPIVAYFLKTQQPDVLCLQETKCRDGEFPLKPLKRLGYKNIADNGQKGYHGDAIASRLPLDTVGKLAFFSKSDARHLSVPVKVGGQRLAQHNFYVPAGGDEPDPEVNPKFAHKLAFLDEMSQWIAADQIAGDPAIMVGDLNVAPLETD